MHNQAANDCDLEPVAYEFFTQAFILYEEEVAVIYLSVSCHLFFSFRLRVSCGLLNRFEGSFFNCSSISVKDCSVTFSRLI